MHKKKGLFLFPVLLFTFFIFLNFCSKSQNQAKEPDPENKINYAVPAGSENWPSFRGVAAAGLAKNQDLPLNWDIKTGKNIKWSFKTPGLGLSAPVIWENRVFITTAIDQVADDTSLKVGLYGDVASVDKEDPHSWEVICLDRDTGKVIWQQQAYKGIPKIKRHPKSSHANSTPATDGKHLVAFFGSEGLYCYDFSGNLLWKRDFGLLDSGFFMMPQAQWEFASSPIIHKETVIIQVDVQKDSFVAALDIKTGKTLWKTKRDEVPTWSTPAVYQGQERTQVILNGFKHIGSYDFQTGEPIWWIKGGGDIPVPTPVFGFGNVYITNAHGRMRPIYAVKLAASGDITPKDEKGPNPHLAWFYERKGAYMPTPIVYGDHLYLCRNNGIMYCFEARTGKEIYKQRVGTMQSAYSASPVAADGKLYFADEFGDIHIVKAGPEFKLLKTNKLKESCLATPAISGKILFIRTVGHLLAVSKGGKTKGIQTRTDQKEAAEEIDLSSVKTDGSIKDGRELLDITAAKLRTIESVSYNITATGIETDEAPFGRFKADITMYKFAGGLPEYFLVKGSQKVSGDQGTKEFIAGSDGNEFYYINPADKTIKKGLEFSDPGADFRKLYSLLITDFVAGDPLSTEKTAKTIEIKEKNELAGEECYQLYLLFPQYGNYELTLWISVKSFLPHRVMAKFKKRDGSSGGFDLKITKLLLNKHREPGDYKIKDLNIYKIIK